MAEQTEVKEDTQDDSSKRGEAILAKRRRLLKIGVSAAPVVLTLASRPVLAWHCNAPSAWGSAKSAGFLGSVVARNKEHEITDETWTIKNWIDNTSRAGLGKPWDTLGLNTTNENSNRYYKKYRVSSLFAGLTTPSGLNGNDKVWDKLNNGSTQFQKYMIVARLNYGLLEPVRKCMRTLDGDQLNQMASGSYRPDHIDVPAWSQKDIIEYLDRNWIVKIS